MTPASEREGAGGRGVRAGVRRLVRLPLRTPAGARADADEELDAFLDERVEHLVARGLTPDRARAEALRRLGAPLDEVRAAIRGSATRREGRKRLRDRADAVRADVRFAVRQFARARAVTAIALLTLALGVGANTAIFSVVHRLLLAPLPYPRGDRILMPVQEGGFPSVASVGGPLLDVWRARTRTVAAMAGASEDLFGMWPDGAVDTIPSATVTANLLPMLGVRPALGRNFAAADEQPEPEAARVAMISYGLWQRAYGERADAVGAAVRVEGRPLTIVGVGPSGFNIPLSRNPAPDVWVPARLERAVAGGSGDLIPGPGLFVTLRPGATVEAASRELRAAARALPAADASRPQFYPRSSWPRSRWHSCCSSPRGCSCARSPRSSACRSGSSRAGSCTPRCCWAAGATGTASRPSATPSCGASARCPG